MSSLYTYHCAFTLNSLGITFWDNYTGVKEQIPSEPVHFYLMQVNILTAFWGLAGKLSRDKCTPDVKSLEGSEERENKRRKANFSQPLIHLANVPDNDRQMAHPNTLPNGSVRQTMWRVGSNTSCCVEKCAGAQGSTRPVLCHMVADDKLHLHMKILTQEWRFVNECYCLLMCCTW